MALWLHPERAQPEWVLEMVYRLLGWNAPIFAGRTCVGVSPFGDLFAEEFVFFVSELSNGSVPSIPSFFV
jgi:hypothetical protein